MKKLLSTTFILFLFLSVPLRADAKTLVITAENPEEITFPGGEIEYIIILDYTAAEKDDKEPKPTQTYQPPTSTPPNPCPPPEPDGSAIHTDIGAKRATVNLSLSKIPEGWDVHFEYDITQYFVEPEEKKEVTLIAKVPVTAELGEYEIEVKVQSDVAKHDPLTLEAEVIQKDLEVVNIQASPQDPKDGEVVNVMAQVRNNSPDDRDVKTRLLVDYNTIEWKTIAIPSGETKSVVFKWTAVEGTHKVGVHAMELPKEPNTDNNAKYVDMNVVKLPIGEADALFQQANNAFYNGDFANAKKYYLAAKELYQQIPNEDRINQCDVMIAKCDRYLEAAALINQAENAFDNDECDKAKELYNRAIDIYEELQDTARMEEAEKRLDEIKEACAPETPPPTTTPPPSFFDTYKTYLAALVVIVLLLLLYFMNIKKRQREEKKEKKAAPKPKEKGERPTPPPTPVVEEKEEKEEEKKAAKSEKEKLMKLYNGTKRILRDFTPEYIKNNIEEAVDVYSVLVKERNEMKRGIDPEMEKEIEENIKKIEERIFSQL